VAVLTFTGQKGARLSVSGHVRKLNGVTEAVCSGRGVWFGRRARWSGRVVISLLNYSDVVECGVGASALTLHPVMNNGSYHRFDFSREGAVLMLWHAFLFLGRRFFPPLFFLLLCFFLYYSISYKKKQSRPPSKKKKSGKNKKPKPKETFFLVSKTFLFLSRSMLNGCSIPVHYYLVCYRTANACTMNRLQEELHDASRWTKDYYR
jgi:hypothetical protein